MIFTILLQESTDQNFALLYSKGQKTPQQFASRLSQ